MSRWRYAIAIFTVCLTNIQRSHQTESATEPEFEEQQEKI